MSEPISVFRPRHAPDPTPRVRTWEEAPANVRRAYRILVRATTHEPRAAVLSQAK